MTNLISMQNLFGFLPKNIRPLAVILFLCSCGVAITYVLYGIISVVDSGAVGSLPSPVTVWTFIGAIMCIQESGKAHRSESNPFTGGALFIIGVIALIILHYSLSVQFP